MWFSVLCNWVHVYSKWWCWYGGKHHHISPPPSTKRIPPPPLTPPTHRLLGLPPAVQQPLFSFYLAVLAYVVDEAKRKRDYDVGIQDVQGVVTSDTPPRVVYTVGGGKGVHGLCGYILKTQPL